MLQLFVELRPPALGIRAGSVRRAGRFGALVYERHRIKCNDARETRT